MPTPGQGLASVLQPTPAGLWCPGGDFYIDPPRPVDRAVITHGHADHARAGHGAVLATVETLAIMGERYGADFAGRTQALSYGERLKVGGVELSLAPAGHVLGSAQATVRQGGLTITASGDYKRRRDPTCAAFEPVPSDVFITDSTTDWRTGSVVPRTSAGRQNPSSPAAVRAR